MEISNNLNYITSDNVLLHVPDAAIKSKSDSKNYWMKLFEGELPSLEFPLDKNRVQLKTPKISVVEFNFDPDSFVKFRSVIEQNHVSVFIGLWSVLNTLLYRYTSQEELIVGSLLKGRSQNVSEPMVLLTKVDGESGFKNLLEKNETVLKETVLNSTYSLNELLNDLKLDNHSGRNPLFDVMFEYTTGAVDQITQIQEKYTTFFDLFFSFNTDEDGLKLKLNYNSDIFNQDTIATLCTHFEGLMNAVSIDSSMPLYKLEYLNDVEKNVLLNVYNDLKVSYPGDLTIVDMFEEQVVTHPSGIALTFENEHITYLELNKRANQLARYLQKKGVKKDTLIPICIERGIGMLVGILGISKAGGAYVPVDPDYPSDRINYILSDTSASLVICSEESALKLPASIDLEIFKIDKDWATISNESFDNLNLEINPADLAYVIYTSGSTGMPKGVLIEHRNIVRLFRTDKPLFDFNEKDIWTMFHSFSFDFSVWEMYGALFYGGRLVIVPKHVTKDMSLYAELLVKEGITILNQTPSAFYVLQDYLIEYDNLVPMRYVIFGGEALSPVKLEPWNTKYPDSKLINMYGITETTVHVTYQEIGQQQIVSGKSLVGRPIPTLTTYILDKHLNLVPHGVAGELCVGGAGLARGYLNRPELTAERFIGNPFGDENGSRLYRSGDLGKRLPDGNIEYLGRMDNQVKIRGYRIELGEIENAIQQFSGIETVTVLPHGDTSAEKYLIAFMVCSQPIDSVDINTFLRSKLPEYMVPSYFEQLNKIPLTSNGKIDRKQLLASFSKSKKTDIYSPDNVPGQNGQLEGNELLFDKIRQMVLKISGIELNAETATMSFIQIGLNSLLITQFAHLLKKEFGLTVTFRQLNDTCSSPAKLTDYLSQNFANNATIAKPLSASENNSLKTNDFINPPRPGAKLGRDKHGNPAWFILNPEQPGKYLQL